MKNSNSQNGIPKDLYESFCDEDFRYYGVFIEMPDKTINLCACNYPNIINPEIYKDNNSINAESEKKKNKESCKEHCSEFKTCKHIIDNDEHIGKCKVQYCPKLEEGKINDSKQLMEECKKIIDPEQLIKKCKKTNNPGQLSEYKEFDCHIFNKFKHIVIDADRFKEKLKMDDRIQEVIINEPDGFFHPAKKYKSEYLVNFLHGKLNIIHYNWEKKQKHYIRQILSSIIKGNEKYINDMYSFHDGTWDANEAAEQAQLQTLLSKDFAEIDKLEFRPILYAQYFHQMAAQIYAAFFQTLHRYNNEIKSFSMPDLWMKTGLKEKDVKNLNGFDEFNKMRLIWNLIKHNTPDAFNDLKEKFHEVLKIQEYNPDELGSNIVNINDELIASLFDKIIDFSIEYCQLCFNEQSWNSEEYLFECVREKIFDITDPFCRRFML